MKVPLTFQNTEYDCCTASFVNALNFLFEREEVPVQLIKAINQYTLDERGGDGVVGEGGTSCLAVERIVAKFDEFSGLVSCRILRGDEVTFMTMRDWINSGGVIVARCYQEQEHYVLITKIDDYFTYLFDPYYFNEDYYVQDTEVAIVLDEMFSHNRVVKNERLVSGSQKDFSLMEPERREAIFIRRA